jgi:hypothetical protein
MTPVFSAIPENTTDANNYWEWNLKGRYIDAKIAEFVTESDAD